MFLRRQTMPLLPFLQVSTMQNSLPQGMPENGSFFAKILLTWTPFLWTYFTLYFVIADRVSSSFLRSLHNFESFEYGTNKIDFILRGSALALEECFLFVTKVTFFFPVPLNHFSRPNIFLCILDAKDLAALLWMP